LKKLVGLALALAPFVTGCAYAVTPFEPGGDAGPRTSDAGAPDAKKPTPDAATTTPPPPPPPPPQDAGVQCQLSLTTGSPACDQCIGQSCCAQENACGASSDCTAFLRCGNDCFADAGDPTSCLNGCAGSFPQGAQMFDALTACMQGSCGNACQ
jgi:hypothetical protein